MQTKQRSPKPEAAMRAPAFVVRARLRESDPRSAGGRVGNLADVASANSFGNVLSASGMNALRNAVRPAVWL